ncbi:MAG: DUF2284 domain-containing protein [Dehalococcoidales bacterium]|nr:DUF2284 domain-containing protein [Dehalococcoidales bacterium]
MSKLESDLAQLCEKALELGATNAIAIQAADIAVDDRTGLKCAVPLCAHYGRDLMCPPNVMPIARFKEVIKCYHQAILLKLDIPENDLRQTRSAQEESRTAYLETLRDSQRKLLEIVGRLEAACLQQGYHFAAGLIGGACPLCKECVGVRSGVACRHPFKARPSMEAMGIDVMSTAKKAGLELDFGDNDCRSWMGLVLVD